MYPNPLSENPDKRYLAVLRLVFAVHELATSSYFSVTDEMPPLIPPEVYPNPLNEKPAKVRLSVFRLAFAVHELATSSYFSVTGELTAEPRSPPAV